MKKENNRNSVWGLLGVCRARGKSWSAAELTHTPKLLRMSQHLNTCRLQQYTHVLFQCYSLLAYPCLAVVPDEIVLELEFVDALNVRAVRKQLQSAKALSGLLLFHAFFHF